MLIKLFDNFIVKIIGSPGQKLLTSMFLEYYDAKVLEELKTIEISKPSLVIFIGKDLKNEIEKYKNVPFLIAILSKKDYELVSNFCKENNLRMYISPTKKIFSYYKHLNLPLFDYINLSLAISTSALRNKALDKDFSTSIVNIDKEVLSIDPHKPFHIRSSQIKKDSVNIELVWEPGTKLIGNKLMMEWIRNTKISNPESSIDFYTVIDIDEIYETKDMKEYLLPFTTLGIYQKGILIVNSDVLDPLDLKSPEDQKDPLDLKSPEDPKDPFDYHIYTNIMELWNTKYFIPKRLSLLENISESLGYKFSENTSNPKFDPKYEISIQKPPIFILDNFESIYNFVSKISKNSMILYIGKKENYINLSKI
jgi:hypothetical protein